MATKRNQGKMGYDFPMLHQTLNVLLIFKSDSILIAAVQSIMLFPDNKVSNEIIQVGRRAKL